MTREKRRSLATLREIWDSLFDEEKITIRDSLDEYQGLLMLLEISLAKTKSLSSLHFNLKSSNDKLLSELEWKTKECNELKIEVHRLENVPCEKCSTLEAEMVRYRKKAVEAQNRMKSIANILRIGENIQDSQSPTKNSAYTLVSQMLLEESPRRKKRCMPRTTLKEIDKPYEVDDCETVIPETLPPVSPPRVQKTPPKIEDGTEIITSPGDRTVFQVSRAISKPPISLNLSSSRNNHEAKRNLTSEFQKKPITGPETVKVSAEERELNSSLELNGSLAEYVRESNSEFDKIWFSAGSSKSVESSKCDEKQMPPSKEGEDIVQETPERSPKKRKPVWKMKEMRGSAEQIGKKRLKQMKLSVSNKKKPKDVDLCSLAGYDGGSLEESSLDEEANTSREKLLHHDRLLAWISYMAGSGEPRNNEEKKAVQEVASTPCSEEFKPKASSTQKPFPVERNSGEDSEKVDTPSSDMDVFKPLSTSTQNAVPSQSSKKSGGSPNYAYKRDAVRKKSERMKLDGWDCENCAAYYATLGITSPSKLKGRLNKCSRHRDKFKPVSNTPPGYWDPIFPDTEECRNRGYYTSFRAPKQDK